MQATINTPEDYINQLPEDRKLAITKLRESICRNLPEGFTETLNYGMIGYVVPHSIYPAGYHVNPKQPLPFINIASQKNFIAFYHMGLYANEGLLQWFRDEYPKYSKYKLDMGKSCVRFKKPDQIPYELIALLVSKISVREWIEIYESQLKAR